MELDRSGDIAVLRMNAGKGNAISPAFFDAFTPLLDRIGDARALVITGVDRFFSAGLALPTLIDLARDDMRSFMQRFEDVMLRVRALPIPTIAAVNGHAIAGGCVLALQCDYRIMAADSGKIGLSEVTLGVGLPTGVVESLRYQVPGPSMFPIAQRGELCDAARAYDLGLVDEVAPAERLAEAAAGKATELAALGRYAYAQVKHEVLRPMLEAIREHRAAGLESWLDTWYSDEARAIIGATVAKLGAKP